MKKKLSPGEVTFNVVVYTLLFLLALICIYPLYQVFVISVSSLQAYTASRGFLLVPQGFNLDAYEVVFSNQNIATGFKNTLFYVVAGTLLQLLSTVTCAYMLSKKNVLLAKPVMIYLSITMYFGGGLIPSYVLINQLHLMDTVWAILLPGAVSTWDIIIMRTQFINLPDGLAEAAMIDGAGDVTVLFRIFLPLSGAVIAVIVLFSVVGYWNMWFDPMLYLTDRSKYPLQSVLREILIDNSTQVLAGAKRSGVRINAADLVKISTLVKYAAVIICTVPILVVYPFLQKYFVKGVMVGSLKG